MFSRVAGSLTKALQNSGKNQLLGIGSKRPLSDALFVHRENDEDIKTFEFTAENKKVCHLFVLWGQFFL